jgi:methylmalonyl-CoA mutase
MKEVKSSVKLFSDFPETSKAQWKDVVIGDLKGADFDKKLVWKTLEGFDLQPYYTADDLSGLDYLKKFEGCTINIQDGSQGPRYWVNREKIVVENALEANSLAIEALNSGADGLVFDLTGKENVDIKLLLNNILPLHCSVSFIADRNAAKLIKGYFTYESENHIETSQLFGSLNYDPLRNLILKGKMAEDGFKILKEIIEVTDPSDRFYGFTVNGNQFQNAGSSLVQELAYCMNMAVEYIEQLGSLGVSAEKVIRNIEFSMAVGTDYFLEIAKLRALREFFYKIAESYGIKNYDPGTLSIHSVSSLWTKTIYDPYVNMLRNTTEAMAAIIGGCNALTIVAYDDIFAKPTPFSKRISRNVSNMMKEESYFDKVADPSAGSYYIENITDQMVKKAWELFTESKRKAVICLRLRQEKSRKPSGKHETNAFHLRAAGSIFVGTNQYPNAKEQLIRQRWWQPVNSDAEVFPRPVGLPSLKCLRLNTDTFTKKTGKDQRHTSPCWRTTLPCEQHEHNSVADLSVAVDLIL